MGLNSVKQRSEGGLYVEETLKLIVDYPESVVVHERRSKNTLIIEATVAKEDMPRVIGSRGGTVDGIRRLLKCIGGRERRRYQLDLLEPVYRSELSASMAL